MQAASYGAKRVLTRKAPPTSRSLHVQSGLRTTLTQKLFTQTRLALSRFVTHLTAPGTAFNTGAASASRSFHAANPSIQQRLSFAARTTLARPLHQARFVPRGPVVPRGMTQVGLGTARNFSSARPVFQQLADNIPVAARAFYEADWDTVNAKTERQKRRRPSKSKAQKASKEMIKPIKKMAPAQVSESDELEHYFPAPLPSVTTHLLIPLAPTPTARAPLPAFPLPLSSSAADGRLPLPALLVLHDAHETHSLRVASLFQRLDTADVWARGVVCEAYAYSPLNAYGGGEGECTVLKVSFAGWSKAAVRGVIGESGTGWCVLEETRHSAFHDSALFEDEDAMSDTSPSSPILGPVTTAADPAHGHSLILPTLDFSSAFLERVPPSPAPSSPSAHSTASSYFMHHSGGSADSLLSATSGSGSGGWSDEAVFVDPPSENGWFAAQMRSGDPWVDTHSDTDTDAGWQMGFSADFSRRLGGPAPEPMESVFA
ncbi:hypothetical protein B0H12DRAFT_1118103 [Mycena haematopus]|nr:hypothetical protein B0H12DRAFT_1118103 [Mycena haematopus]